MSLFRPLGYPTKPRPRIIRIRNLAGNFEHISNTRSLRESVKICRFKTFRVQYFA